MRYGVLLFLGACASATPPGEQTDAGLDAFVKRDSGFEQMIDAPAANVCPSTQTCAAAMMLGTVSGDQPSTALTASGYQSAWFRVRVTENYNDIPGLALSLQSKLTSPAGVNFDTFVYVGANINAIECNATTGTVSNMGNVDQVRAEWGEANGGIPNAQDDARNVSIEVRPIGTNCSPSAMWSLEVSGNWL